MPDTTADDLEPVAPPVRTPEVEVVDENGRTYIGTQVCRGPKSLRLLRTRPYAVAGRTVEVPLDTIRSISRLPDRPESNLG